MHDYWRHQAATLYRRLVELRAAGYDFDAELTEQELNATLERGYRQLRRARSAA